VGIKLLTLLLDGLLTAVFCAHRAMYAPVIQSALETCHSMGNRVRGGAKGENFIPVGLERAIGSLWQTYELVPVSYNIPYRLTVPTTNFYASNICSKNYP
jgi:hypothetical protein